MPVGQELKAGQAAVGSDVLVLLSDRLIELFDLDLTGLLRQRLRVDQVLLVRVQSLQKCGGEAAAGAKSSAGGNVGHARDFQMRLAISADADHSHRFANDGMLDLPHFVALLEL